MSDKDKNWNKEILLEDKLFTPILKDMFEELSDNKVIPSMVEFMYKKQRSYSQIHKVRNYLTLKGVIEINKQGKDTVATLTPKGKRLVKAFANFINILRKAEKK